MMGYAESFFDFLPFVRGNDLETTTYMFQRLLDIEGSVLRETGFPDGGFNGVAFDNTVTNICVDLGGGSGALFLRDGIFSRFSLSGGN